MNQKRHMVTYTFIMTGFAILIGLVCVLFMFLLTKATNLLYTILPNAINFPVQYWPLVYCIVGGLIVGIIVIKIGQYPMLLLEVLGVFKKNGRVAYEGNFIPKDLTNAFIILLFGAALGPEAVLTGLAGSFGTYLIDRLEKNSNYKTLRKEHTTFKRVIFILQWAVGTLLFLFISGLLNLPSFIYRYTETTFHIGEIVWFVPLLLIGVALGLIFTWSEKGFEKIFKPKEGKAMYPKVMFTAVVLGATGVFAPLLLFSGETQVPDLVATASSIAPVVLIIYAVAKLLLSSLCLQTGWRGGNIFPLVFAAFSMAFGIAELLPVDAAFSAAVILAALFSFVVKKPALAAIFVFLYFPLSFIPYIIVSAFLATPKESLQMIKALGHKIKK